MTSAAAKYLLRAMMAHKLIARRSFILLIVSDKPAGQNVSGICKEMKAYSSLVSQDIKELIAEGLLHETQQAKGSDKRNRHYTLTPKGISAVSFLLAK